MSIKLIGNRRGPGKKVLLWAVFILSLFSYFAPFALAKEEAPLYVPQGFARGGIPIKKGILRDVSRIRLTSHDQALPVQSRPLAYWPDGSIKWLLIDTLNHGQSKTGTLILDETPLPTTSEHTCHMKQIKGGFWVSDGVISFMVKKGGGDLIDQLQVGNGKNGIQVKPFLEFVHAKTPEDAPPLATNIPGKRLYLKGRIDSVALEEMGPLHVVLLVKGIYPSRELGQT
ncbi:MAG: hypothetical protein J7M30_13535, partial [Deltaproteobacteria bacterium]|nr:hypothetical protein [Deltaproteobacteria bacterium]